MKKFQLNLNSILAILLGVIMISVSGCTYAFNGIKGSGNVIKQERNVTGFSGIEVGGAFKVMLTQGDQEKLVVEADDNLMDIIKTEVVGKTLKIYTKEDIRNAEEMNIYITFKMLDELEISGACKLTGENKFTLGDLSLDCSGASDVELKLSADDVEMECSGASQIELFGSAGSVNLDLSGASKIDAIEFEVAKLEADISGASHGKMMVTEELSADVSGAASFRYKGDPKINNVDVSGAASFKRY